MQKKVSLLFILLLLLIVIANAETDSITIEPYYPDYLQREEAQTAFFSGQEIVISGEFPKDQIPIITMRGAGGIEQTLTIRQPLHGFIVVELPLTIQSDHYTITVRFSKVSFSTVIFINGLTQEQLDELGQGGGGAVQEEAILSNAILYHSEVPCERCYWESVLDGHPTDDRHLFFAGGWISPYYILLSQDGGKTWEVNRHNYPPDLFLQNDPDSVIGPDGEVYLVGLKWTNDLRESAVKTCALLKGNLDNFPAGESLLVQRSPNIAAPLDDSMTNRLICDFPRIAYDYQTKKLFISTHITAVGLTETGSYQRNNVLFVSRDQGETFIQYIIKEPLVNPILWSMDISPQGGLRASLPYRTNTNTMSERINALVHFHEDTGTFEVVGGIQLPSFSYSGPRLAAEAPYNMMRNYWSIDVGPTIAIDHSGRHNGRIYMVWAQPERQVEERISISSIRYYGYNFDVFLSYSDDDGRTWSQPARVNDDNTWGDQVTSSIDIDTNGIVHIAFIDKREHPGSPWYDIYYTRFVDDRLSINIRVNKRHISNLVERDPGDYLDMIEGYPDKAYIAYPCGAEIAELAPSGMCFTALDPNLVPFHGEFIRGDLNQDFRVDISDVINTLQYLFSGGSVKCEDAADVNDDGKIDLSDPIFLLNYMFDGGAAPNAPFDGLGRDPTKDDLTC